jgi:hypothetical protein
MGLDAPRARRRGPKIHATGIARDPVRASHSQLVNGRGLRWVSLMLLVPLAWAKRGGALPVWTVQAPSERDHQERGPRHKKLTDGARPRLLVVRRGVPERTLGRVPDRRFAVMTRLGRVRQLPQPLCGSTRLRRDAARYELAPPRTPRQTGRPRLQGQRRPTWAHVLPDATTGGSTVTVRG